MPVRFLVGERLYFRPIEEDDLPQYQAWINDPAVRHRLLQFRPIDLKGERAWWDGHDRSQTPGSLHFAICLVADDTLIGSTGLVTIDWLHRCAESGTMIGEPTHRGQGYGTEAKQLLLAYAFDTLNLHRMQSRVFADNTPSLKHLLRCGYVEEGRRREALFRGGGYHDEILLGLLAEEWRAARDAT